MGSIFNFGIDFSDKKWYEVVRDIFIFFITYCIAGWIYEELIFAIEDNIIVNRGAMFGPWLPIYGVGGIIIVMLFYRTKDKKINIGKLNIRPLVLGIETFVLSTLIELVSTYIISFTGGDFKTLWDYSNDFMNFEGRIALIPDIKFGFLAVFTIYLLQPMLIKFTNSDKKIVNIVTIIVFTLFVVDLISRIWLGSNFVG